MTVTCRYFTFGKSILTWKLSIYVLSFGDSDKSTMFVRNNIFSITIPNSLYICLISHDVDFFNFFFFFFFLGGGGGLLRFQNGEIIQFCHVAQ